MSFNPKWGDQFQDLMVFEQIDPLIILAAIGYDPKNHEFDVEWRSKEPLAGWLQIPKY